MDVDQGAEHHAASNFELVSVLAVVALVWYSAVWLISILGCITGSVKCVRSAIDRLDVFFRRKRYRLRPRSPLASADRSRVPGVSILRPLKGLDTNLFENLESTFTQDYPNFEVLLCVADADDQALSVVGSLIEKYPLVQARAVVGTLHTPLTSAHRLIFKG